MSRIGKMDIEIPSGVDVIVEGNLVKVKGPKGEMNRKKPKYLEVKVEDGLVKLSNNRNTAQAAAMHGTIRAHIANMIHGVSEGWSKSLELVGTGYRAQVAGNKLTLSIGYSHPVEIEAPENIKFEIEKNVVSVSGIDKELVGFFSAKIREARPPEPYKGKGIKYQDEVVLRKPGKAAKSAA